MKLNFLFLTTPLAAALLIFFNSGCGGSSTAAIQDGVDYSKSMDLFTAPFGVPSGAPKIDPKSVIAVVDGKPIPRSMFEQGVQLQMMNLKQRMAPEALEQIQPRVQQEVLQRLILQVLLLDAVNEEQIQVSDQQVDARIEELKQGIPQETTWEETLTRSNMTEDKVRDQIQTQMRMDLLLQSRVTDVPSPTDAEMRAFYSENQAQFKQPESAEVRHLLIKVAPDADDAARTKAQKKADELYAFIGKGVSLEKLATRYSEDDASKEKGGLLGKVVRGQLPPSLDKIVFEGEIGTVGSPVQSPAGYHLLTAESRLPAQPMTFEETSEWIKNHLLDTARQAAIREYVAGLEKQADIQIAGIQKEAPAAP